MDEITLASFNIISLSGDSRSLAFEALECANAGNFDEADTKLQEAEKKGVEAHNHQFTLLSKESAGEKVDFSILLAHAQDHLMCSMLAIELIKPIVNLTKELHQLKSL